MNEEITLSYEGKDGQTIRVTATQSMMHPEQCAFTVSDSLLPGSSAYFASREQGDGSPLVEKLFAIENVADVLVTDNVLRINLEGDSDWESKIPLVGEAICDVMLSDDPAVSEAVLESQLPPEEIRRRVQGVLDTVINPAVAAHGGFINLLDVSKNTVFLEFGGGCQGCGMVNVTLKYGVERSIREEVPEVGEILDSTDHASGRNPYYAPASK